VSPVKYKLGSYIPEDGILHSHRRENLKSYAVSYAFVPLCLTTTALEWHVNVEAQAHVH
jgi:hypothetical protein